MIVKEKQKKKEVIWEVKSGVLSEESQIKISLSLDKNHCACCLKLFIIDRQIKCIDCGAQVCRQNCSRCDLKRINSWCCLFCYEERKLLNGHIPWIQTFNYINWESDFSNNFSASFIYSGELKTASESQIERYKNNSEIFSREISYNKALKDRKKTSTFSHLGTLPLMVNKNFEDNILEDVQYNHENNLPFPDLGMDTVNLFEESLKKGSDDTNDIELEYTKINSFVESWKDNWLFRKKNILKCSDTVAMFVPNSNVEYRAMIGDVDADETSDLSEPYVYSDEEADIDFIIANSNEFSAEIDSEYNRIKLKNSQLKSDETKQRNTKFNFSMIDSLSSSLDEQNIDTLEMCISPKYTVPDNNNILKEQLISSSEIQENIVGTSRINGNEYQQYNNYEESDTNIDEEHFDENNGIRNVPENPSYTSFDTKNKINGVCEIEVILRSGNTVSPEPLSIEKDFNKQNLFTPPKPGSIAEREHRKWENAAPMKNNPYSKENIQKRLLQKQSSLESSKILGLRKDYYINDSKVPYYKKKEILECDKETQLTKSLYLPSSVNSADTKELGSKSIIRFNEKYKHDKTINRNDLRTAKAIEETLSFNLIKMDQILKDFNSAGQEVNNKVNETVNDLKVVKCDKDEQKSNFIERKQLDNNDSAEKENTAIGNKNFDYHDNKNNLSISDSNITNRISPGIVTFKQFPNANEGIFDIKISTTKNKCRNNKICQQNNIKSKNCQLHDIGNHPFHKSAEDFTTNNYDNRDDNLNCPKLPSVKEIIQVFDKKQKDETSSTAMALNRLRELKTKRTEFHQTQLNKLPRQLHSLTARSLSKEFREELRHIPNKPNVHSTEKQKQEI